MLLAGLGLLVSGCTQTTTTLTRRPGTPWPTDYSPPTRANAGSPPVAVARPQATPPVAANAGPPGMLPRAWWTKYGPNGSKLNPMAGVNRITRLVHR